MATIDTNLDGERQIVIETPPPTPPNDDEDVREYEALIRDIAELQDADTQVEHMDLDAYRKGKRT